MFSPCPSGEGREGGVGSAYSAHSAFRERQMRTPVVIVILLFSAVAVFAQRDEVIPLDRVIKSQRGTVTQRIANTDISIEYGRPVARGRDIYGNLVPYGRIWHPGANDATSMTVSRDIEVNGKPLPKGKYSL